MALLPAVLTATKEQDPVTPTAVAGDPHAEARTVRKDGIWFLYLEDACREARRSGKPILLFFTGSDWSRECRKLRRAVLDTPEFARWASRRVVPVEVDFPIRRRLPEDRRRESERLHERYRLFRVASKPCLLVIDADGTVLGNRRMRADPSTLVSWIHDAEQFLLQHAVHLSTDL